eukprot:1132957-Amphidinium_carterae.1
MRQPSIWTTPRLWSPQVGNLKTNNSTSNIARRVRLSARTYYFNTQWTHNAPESAIEIIWAEHTHTHTYKQINQNPNDRAQTPNAMQNYKCVL